jgi:uncharacterized protein YjbI with pentapeptide repeats
MIGLTFESINPFRSKFGFEKTILDYSSFYNLALTTVTFSECSQIGCDFSGANLSKVNFKESILTDANFNQTNLTDTDFRTAHGFRINPILNKLKGAKFVKENVLGLLLDFNIKIE